MLNLVTKQVPIIYLGVNSYVSNFSYIALQTAIQPFGKMQDGRHGSKIGPIKIYGGKKQKFQFSALYLFKQLRYGLLTKFNMGAIVPKQVPVLYLGVISLSLKFKLYSSLNSSYCILKTTKMATIILKQILATDLGDISLCLEFQHCSFLNN